MWRRCRANSLRIGLAIAIFAVVLGIRIGPWSVDDEGPVVGDAEEPGSPVTQPRFRDPAALEAAPPAARPKQGTAHRPPVRRLHAHRTRHWVHIQPVGPH
jgi:hypothetical protein